MMVKSLVPAFIHLRLHLPGQPQHQAFGLRVNVRAVSHFSRVTVLWWLCLLYTSLDKKIKKLVRKDMELNPANARK